MALTGMVMAILASASAAWACASLAALDLATPTATPGQEVAFKGTFFNKDNPVEIRWDSLDGQVLATVSPDTFSEGLHGNWRFADGTFTVPADAKAGNYLVIANQEAADGTNTWGIPARTLLQVGDGSPLLGESFAPARPERPDSFLTEESTTVGTLVVVGVGTAGIAMFLSGVAMLVAAGRRSAPRTVRA